ncbi:unnamed protein product [Trichogramma brassicae]|uniref:Uncharacterized protein n=1 Tax=Trichogramma brassicae TaxID=86971 RepID=A0A6H5ITR6_9HYME|nr:unnamed protein product [Trichogramma brassicae]
MNDAIEQVRDTLRERSLYRLTTDRGPLIYSRKKKKNNHITVGDCRSTVVPLASVPGPTHRLQDAVDHIDRIVSEKAARVAGASRKIMQNPWAQKSPDENLCSRSRLDPPVMTHPSGDCATETQAYIPASGGRASKSLPARDHGGEPHVSYDAMYL